MSLTHVIAQVRRGWRGPRADLDAHEILEPDLLRRVLPLLLRREADLHVQRAAHELHIEDARGQLARGLEHRRLLEHPVARALPPLAVVVVALLHLLGRAAVLLGVRVLLLALPGLVPVRLRAAEGPVA